MLKNEDIKQINKARTILGMIWAYAIEVDNNELYEKTGVTIKDLHDSMTALTHIHVQETLKHLKQNEKSNAWNKAHPEQHRKHTRESHRRHPRKEYQHEYYLKRKANKEVK